MGKQVTTTTAAAVALIAVLLSLLSAPASAGNFTCLGSSATTCKSLLGYPVANSTTTTYNNIASLFNVSLGDLLAANNATNSAANRPVSKPTVTVPIPCTCFNNTGTSGNNTRYTVKKGDGLDAIARTTFGLLVTYQEVASFNNIPNPDKIDVGQVVSIPLPCSCDQDVPGETVLHYAYKVADGDTFDSIAKFTGATAATIQTVNRITDPKALKAESILDVPLRTCEPSPSPLIAGTNLTSPTPCPAAAPGSPTTPSPPSPATRALPGLGWTPLLVLSHVMVLLLSIFPRQGC